MRLLIIYWLFAPSTNTAAAVSDCTKWIRDVAKCVALEARDLLLPVLWQPYPVFAKNFHYLFALFCIAGIFNAVFNALFVMPILTCFEQRCVKRRYSTSGVTGNPAARKFRCRGSFSYDILSFIIEARIQP